MNIKLCTLGLFIILTSTACYSSRINPISERLHQAFIKVALIQKDQTKDTCYDNLSGRGFEFASGHVEREQRLHAKESLYWQLISLDTAKKNNCKHSGVISWAIAEGNKIWLLI